MGGSLLFRFGWESILSHNKTHAPALVAYFWKSKIFQIRLKNITFFFHWWYEFASDTFSQVLLTKLF
jgi:hypothetical protein